VRGSDDLSNGIEDGGVALVIYPRDYLAVAIHAKHRCVRSLEPMETPVAPSGAYSGILEEIAATEHGAAAVVMASHGRAGIVRSIVGSVAGETLHHSPCPVMLIRPATVRPAEESAPSEPTTMRMIIA
jgi:nucleotide-binding universal stress UspA family protein